MWSFCSPCSLTRTSFNESYKKQSNGLGMRLSHRSLLSISQSNKGRFKWVDLGLVLAEILCCITFPWNTNWCSPIPPAIFLAHSHLGCGPPRCPGCQLMSNVTGVVCKSSCHSSSVADTAMLSFESTFCPPTCCVRG